MPGETDPAEVEIDAGWERDAPALGLSLDEAPALWPLYERTVREALRPR